MDLRAFRILLETSSKKNDIFRDPDILNSIEFEMPQLIKLIKSKLSSEEIFELFNNPFYRKLPENQRNELISSIKLPKGYVCIYLAEPELINALASSESFIKRNIDKEELPLFCSVLQDPEIERIIQWYSREHDTVVEIYKLSYSSNKKISILTEENDLTPEEKLDVLLSIKEEELIGKFLYENPDFCNENGITKEELMNKLIQSNRARYTYKNRSLDITDFPPEFRKCVGLRQVENTGFVVIDLNSDLEKYRGLDKKICLAPEDYDEEKRIKLMELCEICPDLTVINILNNQRDDSSSGKEYEQAEKWISYVISKLKPNFSKAQKTAIIDNEIGKRINFTPNEGTKDFDQGDARALWKIISSGFGVCNGISNAERYILKRAGIEAKLVNAFRHTFLRVDDVDMRLLDEQSISLNGILDPTWNLAAHKFGGKPELFLISYEDARKQDVSKNGEDFHCHDKDEELQDLKHSLDDDSLRELFYSVGLTNEDRTFPLENLMKRLKSIDEEYKRQSQRDNFEKAKFINRTIQRYRFNFKSDGFI